MLKAQQKAIESRYVATVEIDGQVYQETGAMPAEAADFLRDLVKSRLTMAEPEDGPYWRWPFIVRDRFGEHPDRRIYRFLSWKP